jgi:hypothetical protein
MDDHIEFDQVQYHHTLNLSKHDRVSLQMPKETFIHNDLMLSDR